MKRALVPVAALAAALSAVFAAAADKEVYSWRDTFAAGFAFFKEVNEHPSQVRTVSTAQYAMLVKNEGHEFRICRLHYSDDGKTPVGVCEAVVSLDELPEETN